MEERQEQARQREREAERSRALAQGSILSRQDGAWHVFAVEGGEASLRAVQIGHRSAESAEVVKGLRKGDTVILFPSDQIADGVSVAP